MNHEIPMVHGLFNEEDAERDCVWSCQCETEMYVAN